MTSHASPAAAAGPSLSPLQAAPPSSSSVQPVAVDASGLTPCHPAGAPWGTPSVTGPPPSPGLKPKAQTPGAFVSHSRSITRSAAVTLGLHCPSPWHVVAAQSSGTELVRLAPCGWRGSDGHGPTPRAAARRRALSVRARPPRWPRDAGSPLQSLVVVSGNGAATVLVRMERHNLPGTGHGTTATECGVFAVVLGGGHVVPASGGSAGRCCRWAEDGLAVDRRKSWPHGNSGRSHRALFNALQ